MKVSFVSQPAGSVAGAHIAQRVGVLRISRISHDRDRSSRLELSVYTQKVLGHRGAIEDEGSGTGSFAAKGLIRTSGV